MNKVILIGNVGANPEIKTLDNGSSVANFSLATDESYINKDGEKVPQTEWHNLECWNGLVKIAEQFIKKGDRLCIEGKLHTEKWEKDGINKSITKIKTSRIELLGNRREQVEKEVQPQEQGKATPTKKGKKVVFEGNGDNSPF